MPLKPFRAYSERERRARAHLCRLRRDDVARGAERLRCGRGRLGLCRVRGESRAGQDADDRAEGLGDRGSGLLAHRGNGRPRRMPEGVVADRLPHRGALGDECSNARSAASRSAMYSGPSASRPATSQSSALRGSARGAAAASAAGVWSARPGRGSPRECRTPAAAASRRRRAADRRGARPAGQRRGSDVH